MPISKRVFQENRARQIFRKTNISYTLIHIRTCVYQGIRNVCFSENLGCFFSWNTHHEIRPFALSLTICLSVRLTHIMLLVSFYIYPVLRQTISFQIFKGCLPQVLLGPLLNTLTQTIHNSFSQEANITKPNANEISVIKFSKCSKILFHLFFSRQVSLLIFEILVPLFDEVIKVIEVHFC